MTQAVHEAITGVYDKLSYWLTTLILMLPNLLVAIVIFLLFYAAGRLIRRWLSTTIHRIFHSDAIAGLLLNLIFGTFILIGIFIALGILKLDKAVTSLLAGAGIVGLALGFAFQDIVSNFVSGILLAIRKPFKANDIVESNGYLGIVTHLSLRTVMIRTFQGQQIYIPNKDIYTKSITNYTSEGRRRIELHCGVSYHEDLSEVKKLVLEAIGSIEYLIDGENVSFFYKHFGASAIDFEVRYWTKFSREEDYLQAVSDGIMKIKAAFDANDIRIPFPITTIDLGTNHTAALKEELLKIQGEN